MRIVGSRTERPLSFSASTDLLVAGARFNEGLQGFAAGRLTGIPKGIYRFRSHREANRFDADCSARRMAEFSNRKA